MSAHHGIQLADMCKAKSLRRLGWTEFASTAGNSSQQTDKLTYATIDICQQWHILSGISSDDKPIVWLEGEIKTPPFSREARIEAGTLLRRLQQRERVGMPHSRPMPSIGRRCHELRIPDENATWRIVYRLDTDAVVIGEVFAKKTNQTSQHVIESCKRNFRRYDEATK